MANQPLDRLGALSLSNGWVAWSSCQRDSSPSQIRFLSNQPRLCAGDSMNRRGLSPGVLFLRLAGGGRRWSGAMTDAPVPVLFFDGECGLCNRVVRLLLRLDTRGRLRFAPLQGPVAQDYLRAHGL